MKLLFINPSLRPGSSHLFLPVGLAYVMTYVKKGFDFDLLDVDVGNREWKITLKKISTMLFYGKYRHSLQMDEVVYNMIKSHQPSCKLIVGNSLGGSLPEVLLRLLK